MGRSLIPELLKRGHEVKAIVREKSVQKLPAGCTPIIGDPLDKNTLLKNIPPFDTLIQLLGISHPNPSKAQEFRAVDLVSVQASVCAAVEAGISQFIYVSVAQPAPIMKDYVRVRLEAEATIKASGLNATILRPWYVLGPGHRWPYVLVPMYWILERFPATRESARRLGLVTLRQMIAALTKAVEQPCRGIRIVEVPQIKSLNAEQRTKEHQC